MILSLPVRHVIYIFIHLNMIGTPSGVGELKVGDSILAGLGHDYIQMRYKCVPKPLVLKK